MIDDGRAIFQQIADHVADSIIDGTLEETCSPIATSNRCSSKPAVWA